jgi:hypothetical protein
MRPIGYVFLLLIAVALAFSATRLGAERWGQQTGVRHQL